MTKIVPITVAHGDGIGPEIMEAVLYILKEAGAKIRVETIEIGEKLYKRNYSSGIAEDTWESLARTKILLKAPITTPLGGGYKSLNVTLRKALGLYSNVRPCASYHPFIKTHHPELDVVIVRENEEDLYAGIEYRQTHNMYQTLKLVSKVGSERIIRYAFEYAVKNNRKKVSCFSKDNIMKFSDGIFHKTFDKIAKEYPQIENDYYIIDIGTAKLADSPEIFDVIVTSNLYGDIISDVVAETSGSVGCAGSANIGDEYAMFEAIHGSAPDIAGKNIANPSGLINAAIMMLIHIGQGKTAAKIENAWKKTIEDGVHTVDIYSPNHSKQKVSTDEFAKELVKRLGQKPTSLKAADYEDNEQEKIELRTYSIDKSESKKLVGADIFIDIDISNAKDLANKLTDINIEGMKLQTICSKGLKLWPSDFSSPIISDHWCCRFKSEDNKLVTHDMLNELLKQISNKKLDYIKVENLYDFNDIRGYSLAQGE